MSSESISSGDWTMPSLRLNPTAKSSQVLRRAHHDGVGAAIIGQRNRGLLRNRRACLRRGWPSRQTCRSTVRTGSCMRYSAASTPARCGASGGPARHRPSAIRRTVRRRNLHRRDLVFRAVGGPVGILRGDDVGLRVRVMERGVDHARRHAIGDHRAQGGFAGAARRAAPSRRRVRRAARRHADGSPAGPRSCQTTLSVRRVCAPTLYWLRMRPVVSSSGIARPGALVGRRRIR
mgnify:CR=1 FL=1